MSQPESKKHRDATPSRRLKSKSKSRENSPKKSIHSRTATPTHELNESNIQSKSASRKSSRNEAMDTTEGTGVYAKKIIFFF